MKPLAQVWPASCETANPERFTRSTMSPGPVGFLLTWMPVESLYVTTMFWPAAATEVSLCVALTKGRDPGKIWMTPSATGLLTCRLLPRSWTCGTVGRPVDGGVPDSGRITVPAVV